MVSLKERRENLGYRQEYISYHCGVTRQTVINIEKGFGIPSVILAKKLAPYYGCSLEEFAEIIEKFNKKQTECNRDKVE